MPRAHNKKAKRAQRLHLNNNYKWGPEENENENLCAPRAIAAGDFGIFSYFLVHKQQHKTLATPILFVLNRIFKPA